MNENILLDVQGLTVEFSLDKGKLRAVDNISFFLENGQTLGMVGESGCGKSMTALSILNLVPLPGRIACGSILFNGDDILGKTRKEMRTIRGGSIGMIFQEPMTSLNPVFTIGNQIDEALLAHTDMTRKQAKARTIELLGMVNIPMPEKRYAEYPHQLSGGMRQRVMIAMALSCSPQLLICDEPTTALDVTVQNQILRLLNRLKEQLHMSMMLISHDLAVISEMCDKVVVMYAGRIVEQCSAKEIFSEPLHPYTQALLASIPAVNKHAEKLHTISGSVPDLTKPQPGCLFAPRCQFAGPECFQTAPALTEKSEGHWVGCLKYRREA